jgi:hypothetical protein
MTDAMQPEYAAMLLRQRNIFRVGCCGRAAHAFGF